MFDSATFLEATRAQGVKIIEPRIQSGGNSRIYIFSLNDQFRVLKVYKGEDERKEKSRERELSAYKFLNENGFKSLPKLFEDIKVLDGLCLEYIDGEHPEQDMKINRKILNSMRQLAAIFQVDSSFKDAVDACYSTDDLVNQIQSRIFNSGISLPGQLEELGDVLVSLRNRYPISFPIRTHTYSMSDIGVHNIIRSKGSLVFLDLEFFGKDSAVKMIIDFLLHPKNRKTPEIIEETLKFAETQFGIDLDLVHNVIPFVAAKWAAIILRRINLLAYKRDGYELNRMYCKYIDLAKIVDKDQIHAKLQTLR